MVGAASLFAAARWAVGGGNLPLGDADGILNRCRTFVRGSSENFVARAISMAEADRMLGTFLHLARASHVRRQPLVRDKLLILAGVQAAEMGLDPISALCRHKILAHNAHHLVGQWPTFDDALGDAEFQGYLKQLRRRYSREKTEHMLDTLEIELGREREAYFTDLEYAAALLDTRPEAIDDILAAEPRQLANGHRSESDVHATEPGNRGFPWGPERIVATLFGWGALVFGVIVAVVLAILLWASQGWR